MDSTSVFVSVIIVHVSFCGTGRTCYMYPGTAGNLSQLLL